MYIYIYYTQIKTHTYNIYIWFMEKYHGRLLALALAFCFARAFPLGSGFNCADAFAIARSHMDNASAHGTP
jgi:hypothetical protein